MNNGSLRNKHYRLWNDWQFYYKEFWMGSEAEAPREEIIHFADYKEVLQWNIRNLLVINMPW